MPNKRILLVEDEEAVSDILQEMLALLGHAALVVRSAEAALECTATEEFSALLADNKLPGMTGLDLAHRVHQATPATKIIITTGQGYLVSKPLPFSFTLLAKPFSFQNVRDALHDIPCTIAAPARSTTSNA